MTENTQTGEQLPATQGSRQVGRPMKPSEMYKAHQEEAKNLKAGRIFLKFSKGDWFIGKDADTFPNNEFYFVPAMDMFERGWQCWKGGKPVDEKFVAYGGPGIPQSELPDHGPYPGKNDGWAEAIKFPLIIVPHGQNTVAWMNVEFAASSAGGKNACYSLSKQFTEKIKLGEITDDKPYPLVRASVDSYVHKEWGKVPFPVFEVMQGLTEEEVRKLLGSAKSTVSGNSDKADEPGETAPAAPADKGDLDKKATRKPKAEKPAEKPAAKPADTKPAGSGAPGWDGDERAEAAADDGVKYHAVRDGKKAGPYSISELGQAVAAGWFKPETMVWTKGMTGWTKAVEIAVLEALFVPDEPPEPEVPDVPDEPEAPDLPPDEPPAAPPEAAAPAARPTRKRMAV